MPGTLFSSFFSKSRQLSSRRSLSISLPTKTVSDLDQPNSPLRVAWLSALERTGWGVASCYETEALESAATVLGDVFKKNMSSNVIAPASNGSKSEGESVNYVLYKDVAPAGSLTPKPAQSQRSTLQPVLLGEIAVT
jgi:hypothetical protein